MTMSLTRADAETFLYYESRLLDEWKLEAWAELFEEDGEYLIPSTDQPDGDPGSTLFLVYDDRHRLGERAKRLLKRAAHAEFPHSRVRHMISNIEVGTGEGDLLWIRCNFVVYRSRGAGLDVFPGHAIYDVRIRAGGVIRIRRKRAVIDTDTLRTQRRMSIIL
jgi:p-cumate 2,3-dioxygenase beta subunit